MTFKLNEATRRFLVELKARPAEQEEVAEEFLGEAYDAGWNEGNEHGYDIGHSAGLEEGYTLGESGAWE